MTTPTYNNTHYQPKYRLRDLITGRTIQPLLRWFKENKFKLNLDKCHLIVSGIVEQKLSWMTLPLQIQKKEILLGIIFDDRLKFQYHNENVCKKAKAHCLVLLLLLIYHKRKFYSMPFFSHSLVTALWFGCVIAEYSITK